MEPLEPTDLEISRYVRRDVKTSVTVPDRFERFSANGSIVLMGKGCGIVVTPVTDAFSEQCKKLHAAGGLTPIETTFGAHRATLYESPGQKKLYYLNLDGVAFQAGLDPGNSEAGIRAITTVLSSLKVVSAGAI